MAENNHTVISLVIEMSKNWDKVKWEDVTNLFKGPYESGLLKLNCDKALAILNWKAVLNFEETIQMTSLWYKEYYTKPSMNEDFTISQINEYIIKAKIKGLKWAQ
jgi:CDP-glucose 4,6-dehydratase